MSSRESTPTESGDQQGLSPETSGTGNPAPEIQLATIQFNLPPFWSGNPQAWFCQVEAQFSLRRVTSQLAKYYHVVSSLPMNLVEELGDFLATPPSADAYDQFKAVLLRRTTESESSRLRQLLNPDELGDRRPTQMLTRMRQLLGAQPPGSQDNILRELFVQRLPLNMRMILASAGNVPLDDLAAIADKIADYAVPSVSSVTPTARSVQTSSLEERLDLLTEAVETLQLSHRDRQRSPHQPSFRRRSPGAVPGRRLSYDSRHQEEGLCWYHARFAERARKCLSPCSWTGNAPAGR